MTAKPLVSVITIFLDEERFLAESVESVLAQTYGEWELLLCDDGSTDGSTRIARRFAAAHPDRIRYLEHAAHSNRGMSATRNLGIANARGALLGFLDADDVWENGKLERQVAVLLAQPQAAMVYGPSRVWHGWTGEPADAARDEYRRLGARPDRLVSGRTMLGRILRGRAESPGTCSVLIRTDAAKSVGGFEESFRGMFEDQAFFAKVFVHHDVWVMGESLDRYRQHPDSTCSRAIRSGDHDPELPGAARDRYLRWLGEYLRQIGGGRDLRGIVARELWLYRHPRLARLRRRLIESGGRLRGRLGGPARRIVRRTLFLASLPPLRRWWYARRHGDGAVPPPGLVRFGSLRRLTPISRDWGDDRGGPIDRHYITGFLDRNRADVRGRVLEIAEDVYTKWFGDDRVERSDVLQYREGEHPHATFTADLTDAPGLPSDAFDCVIVTQTLQLIFDLDAAIATVHRILRPGGVALVTVPGITPVSRHDTESWGEHWCWSFTARSMRMLFEKHFRAADIRIETHGNVLAAAAFLYGLGRPELSRAELDHRDPDYEMLITVRARKAESGS